jgi:hypothetical protein
VTRRLGLAALAGGWAFVASIGGTILLFAWLFTDHVFWYKNLNLFQLHPFFLALALAYWLFLLRGSFPKWGRMAALALGIFAGIGSLLGFLPGMNQANGEVLAFLVPVNGALVLGSLWLSGPRATRGEAPAERASDAKSASGAG